MSVGFFRCLLLLEEGGAIVDCLPFLVGGMQ